MTLKEIVAELSDEFLNNHDIVPGVRAFYKDNPLIVESVVDRNAAVVHPPYKHSGKIMVNLSVLQVIRNDVQWRTREQKSLWNQLISQLAA